MMNYINILLIFIFPCLLTAQNDSVGFPELYKENYVYLNDLHKANFHLEKSFELSKQKKSVHGMVNGGIALADNYIAIGRYGKALKYFQSVLDVVLQEFNEKHPMAERVHLGMADTYFKLSQYDNALSSLDKYSVINPKVNARNIYNVVNAKVLEGNAWKGKGDFVKARTYYNKALEIIRSDKSGNPIGRKRHVEILIELAKLEGKANKEKSLEYLRSGVAILLADDSYQLGNPIDVEGSNNGSVTLAKCLFYASETLISKKEKRYLELAANLLDDVDFIFDGFYRDFDFKSIGDLRKRNYSVLENGFISALDLYDLTKEEKYLEKAFYYMEKSKSLFLLQGIREEKITNIAGVPQELIVQEKDTRNLLGKIESKLKRLSEENNSNEITELRNEKYELKKQQEDLLEKYKKEYPDYFRNKYDYRLIDISNLKSKINADDIWLQYFWKKDAVAIFLIDRNGCFVFRESNENISEILNEVVAGLGKGKSSEKEIKGKLEKLSDVLLPKQLKDIIPNKKRLVIIPDGPLDFLPFEALVQEGNYLLEKINISYGHSATSLIEQIGKPVSGNGKGLAAFAAEYDKGLDVDAEKDEFVTGLLRDGLYDLPGAKSEVEKITEITGGDSYIGQEGTLKRFIAAAPRYKILHLAMHSHLNEKNPLFSSLLFTKTDSLEENRLTATDIYNLELDADMVVLSACNTGSGRFERGEGIISLSRAFSYAGVHSNVMSLWKVPDVSTSEIMTSFYNHLKSGVSKDEALRKAKLHFLENTDISETRHPFYWAGFVLSGDPKPINDSFNRGGVPYLWVIVISILAIMAAFFFFRKK